MNDLIILVTILTVLLIVLAIVTVVGHVIWLVVAAILRPVFGSSKQPPVPSISPTWHCLNCNFEAATNAPFCNVCGSPRPSRVVVELQRDLTPQNVRLCGFVVTAK